MAISRAQLLKELLPGLNSLFRTQYYGDPATWFKKEDVVNRPHIQEIDKLPSSALRDIWIVRFGETVTAEVLHTEGVIDKDSYIGVVGEVLATRGFLTYDKNTQTFTLTEEPHYAHPRK